jgi:hypothetical protein
MQHCQGNRERRLNAEIVAGTIEIEVKRARKQLEHGFMLLVRFSLALLNRALRQAGACRFIAIAWLALAAAYAQQPTSPSNPPLAKDPGPFLPGFGSEQDRAPKAVAGPAPHLPDGRPDFGGDGAWYPGFNGNLAETKWKGVKSADKHVDVPFLPWTLQTFNERVENGSKDDPEARCLPVGVPRFMFDPYPFQMIQTSNQVVFVFEGDNYLWRIVNIDPTGTHPKNLKPTVIRP